MKYRLMRPLRNPISNGGVAVLTEIDLSSTSCLKGSVVLNGKVLDLEWDHHGHVKNNSEKFNLLTTVDDFKDVKEYLNCIIN